VLEVQGQRGVATGRVCRRKAGHLDGGEVAMFLSTHADIAVAGSSAARFPGQCGDMCLGSCGRIEAVDGRAACIVEEIGFRAGDEMAQLIVSALVSVDAPCACLWPALTR
jgi:hypothetical protein